MDNREYIAKRIKEIRLEKGLSQEKLAEKTKISRQYILQRVESGKYNLKLDTIQKIADALDKKIDFIDK